MTNDRAPRPVFTGDPRRKSTTGPRLAGESTEVMATSRSPNRGGDAARAISGADPCRFGPIVPDPTREDAPGRDLLTAVDRSHLRNSRPAGVNLSAPLARRGLQLPPYSHVPNPRFRPGAASGANVRT